jgi:hypothetical protein
MANYAADQASLGQAHAAIGGWRISPLELPHPDGAAGRALVLGGACPPMLYPAATVEPGEPADLVVLAPTTRECRAPGWLASAADAAAQSLADDGLVYVLAPRRARPRIRRLLRERGLLLGPSMAHFPNWSPPRHQVIVPLEMEPARFAFANLIALSPLRRRLARAACRLSIGRYLLARLLPGAAIVARRPGARPLFGWLGDPNAAPEPGSAIISARQYGADGTVVLHPFEPGASRPSAIFKQALTASMAAGRRAEADLLRRLGLAAAQAGARVPQAALVETRAGHLALRQTVVSGRSAATWLATHPSEVAALAERVADWVISWNAATARRAPLDPALLQVAVLAPAQRLAPHLGDAPAYLDWLQRRCVAAAGAIAPLVATHNDLTMWNILLDGDAPLGVIDWELARDADLPLSDLCYALADAVAAASGYRDRPAAFESCFLPGGDQAPLVGRLLRRAAARLALAPEVATLCLHATWLRHAANEAGKKLPGEAHPMLAVVRTLAQRRFDLERQVAE